MLDFQKLLSEKNVALNPKSCGGEAGNDYCLNRVGWNRRNMDELLEENRALRKHYEELSNDSKLDLES